MANALSSGPPSAADRSHRSKFPKIFRNDFGLRAGWRILIYICLFVSLVYVLDSGLDYFIEPGSGVLADGLFQWLALSSAIGAAWVMARIEKRSMSTYGLPTRSAFKKLFWQGWLVGLIEVTVLVGLIAAFHGYSFGKLAERGRASLLYGLSWAVVSVVVSLFDEFAFRGYMQRTLADGIGYWSAAVVLSAIFASAHLLDPVEGWIGAFVLMTVGLFWCLTLRRTGSLWFAVGMHASFKFGDTFLFSVPNIGPGFPTQGHLSHAILRGPAWMTGGAMGPEASIFRFLTVAVLCLALNKVYPAKAAVGQDVLTGPATSHQ